MNEAYDLLVVGGGINGAGIARDAAGRGLRVLLCEQDDLAGATSSASTKLIHGGLRYLEHREFRLVRESLMEREVLLSAAPHIVRPLVFVLPHVRSLRPAWMIRLGLVVYDRLGGRRRLPASHAVDLRRGPYGSPLQEIYDRGFSYADCWVDDARLVVLNIVDAAERGARVLTRTACTAARGADGCWRAELQPKDGGPGETVEARALVNATGPWAERFLERVEGRASRTRLRLVKGSHIVVPRLYDGDHAYILQNDDRRVVFAIPYEEHFTLIGTTEQPWQADPGSADIDEGESAYLCRAVNRYFRRQIAPGDAVWSYSGVRPLYDSDASDVSALTRDYVFDVDAPKGKAPLLSVLGGKLTTYRRLAEHALEKLAPHLGGGGRPWTAAAPLPGGDLGAADARAFAAELTVRHPWLPRELARRYSRTYGSRAEHFLHGARAVADLGPAVAEGLYAAELEYLVREEWARTAEDILWRRTKLGLHLSAGAAADVDRWLAARAGADDGSGASPRRSAAISPEHRRP